MPVTTVPISTLLRERTDAEHAAAEASPFMARLLAGEADLAAYADLLVQLQPVYAALERGHELLDGSEVAPLLQPGLRRSDRLAADLSSLHRLGVAVEHDMTEAAAVYAARITEVADAWPAGYVAHHWTRYLGDLAGGQLVRRVLTRAYGLDESATTFYAFPDLPAAPVVRRSYRESLDAMPWSDEQAEAVADEAVAAFRHNRALFTALDARHPQGV